MTIRKMNKHVSRLQRELTEARDKMRRHDSDSESEDDRKRRREDHDEKEKPTEEAVESMEEKLEAAQADQKNLFLIIFQVRHLDCCCLLYYHCVHQLEI